MNERARLEVRFDVMPDTVAALRNETPEQFRLRKMRMLREDVAAYCARLDVLRSLRPGDLLPCGSGVPMHQQPVVTAEWLADEIKAAMESRDRCSDEFLTYSLREAHEAADRAELWLARAIKPVQVA